MQPATYQTVTGQEFQRLARPTQGAPVLANVDAAEVSRYIKIMRPKWNNGAKC